MIKPKSAYYKAVSHVLGVAEMKIRLAEEELRQHPQLNEEDNRRASQIRDGLALVKRVAEKHREAAEKEPLTPHDVDWCVETIGSIDKLTEVWTKAVQGDKEGRS